MSIIKKIDIKKFRAFEEISINVNRPINIIAGQNGAMKTTLLGLLSQPFSMKTGAMQGARTIDGYIFQSKMLDKFKFSPTFDVIGEHEWTLQIDKKIYDKENITVKSIARDKKTRDIRFWSTEGREKGMGFVQCPVMYLSLKRLSPIGEERKVEVNVAELDENEIQFFSDYHNRILISTQTVENVATIKSSNKSSMGVETNTSDSLTISAGQDNVGKIIMSVMSFARLKKLYGNEYHGGVIFIDELESTLYPAAQEKLVDFMFYAAEQYNIQFFCTSHSMTVIKYVKMHKNNSRTNILYLQKVGNKILCNENPELIDIENHLNVMSGKTKSEKNLQIKVYCEDSSGIAFAKSLLPKTIKDHLNFIGNMHLSWTVYRDLYRGGVPEFKDNIVLLDGDVEGKNWKNPPKNSNIMFLPGGYPPEQVIYNLLYSLDENDSFWDNSMSGYSKQVCFRGYPNKLEEIDHIKQWYKSQKDVISYAKFLNLWKKKKPEEVEKFICDFIKTYNKIAQRRGYNLLSR